MDRFRMWNPSVKKYTYFSRPELVDGVSYGPKSEMMSGMIFHADGPMYITPYDEPEWCTDLHAAKSCWGDGEDARLVFAGDILQSRIGDKHIWEVRFYDGAFEVVQIKTKGKGRNKGEFSDICCSDNLAFYALEIIGTIHDYPELLKEVKA